MREVEFDQGSSLSYLIFLLFLFIHSFIHSLNTYDYARPCARCLELGQSLPKELSRPC